MGNTWEWRANLYSYLSEENKIKQLDRANAFVESNNIIYQHFYETEQAYILGGDSAKQKRMLVQR